MKLNKYYLIFLVLYLLALFLGGANQMKEKRLVKDLFMRTDAAHAAHI